MYVFVTHTLGGAMSRACMMFQRAIKKLFEWLFSRMLASHRGRPGSIQGLGHVSLGTSCLGWRWHWSILFITESNLIIVPDYCSNKKAQSMVKLITAVQFIELYI
jgi:hypothetical protein